jgi:hypothetical protein
MINNNTNAINSQIQQLQALQGILTAVTEAAGGPIGTEAVLDLMRFSGVYRDINQSTPTASELLQQVKDIGIILDPALVALIKNSPTQNIKSSIAIYVKVYSQVKVNKPSNLFYTILKNENLQAGRLAS